MNTRRWGATQARPAFELSENGPMAESMTAERANKVQISDAGPSAKKLHIEIPAETVGEKLKGQVDMLSTEAQLPGFRKGRVPRWLIEKRFGTSVRKEAKLELARAAVESAIKENKLSLVSDPTIGNLDSVEIKEGSPLSFEVEVEVLPEFTMPALDGIEIRRPTMEVSDDLVTEEVNKLCINEGSLEPRDQAEPGDYLTGHAIMVGDDTKTEFYNLKGAVIQKPTADKNGKGMMLGIMVEDFDSQVGSPKAGQSVTVKATGPEQHEIEGIRSAKLTMTFQIDRIDRIKPAATEDIVRMFGFENEARLRDLIKSRLQQRVVVQQQMALHQQVARHLLKSVEMELPQRMTAGQASRNLDRRRMDLMYRGFDLPKIEEHMAELRAASSESAARELKLFFILHRAAEELRVQVTEGDVNQRIAQIAMQRNARPDQVRQELIQTRQAQGLVNQVREHKTLDAIVARAKISDMPSEEFNTMMAEAAKEDAKNDSPSGSSSGAAAADASEAKAEKKPAKKKK
jgi:trigger factor